MLKQQLKNYLDLNQVIDNEINRLLEINDRLESYLEIPEIKDLSEKLVNFYDSISSKAYESINLDKLEKSVNFYESKSNKLLKFYSVEIKLINAIDKGFNQETNEVNEIELNNIQIVKNDFLKLLELNNNNHIKLQKKEISFINTYLTILNDNIDNMLLDKIDQFRKEITNKYIKVPVETVKKQVEKKEKEIKNYYKPDINNTYKNFKFNFSGNLELYDNNSNQINDIKINNDSSDKIEIQLNELLLNSISLLNNYQKIKNNKMLDINNINNAIMYILPEIEKNIINSFNTNLINIKNNIKIELEQ